MKIEDLKPSKGSRKKPKRVGRGYGSGHGKTSCKGHKGQKARSGGTTGPGFEGGQTPLQRRLPKHGFKNIFAKPGYNVVNLKTIDTFSESLITPELILEKGIIKDIRNGVKILGEGEIKRPVTLRAHAISASAKEKILQAGGKVEIITQGER
ncbi:MAG: 50S ribosomal protein L15 [Nitrospirae bacterium]|nr:50S ribosomal protein L15 [Nitrospirota bacterium]